MEQDVKKIISTVIEKFGELNVGTHPECQDRG